MLLWVTEVVSESKLAHTNTLVADLGTSVAVFDLSIIAQVQTPLDQSVTPVPRASK